MELTPGLALADSFGRADVGGGGRVRHQAPSVLMIAFGLPGAPEISFGELVDIERLHQRAFDIQSLDEMPGVVGFGEIGVVLRWPADAPRAAVKRLLPADDQAGADHQIERIVRAAGILASFVDVAPTAARFVPTRSGGVATYLVQPFYPAETLVESILSNAEPDPNHPVVMAMRDAIVAASGAHAVLDSQFSNFSFVDGRLVLFDNGSAILLNRDGSADTDFGVALDPVPGPLRSVARRKVGQISEGLAGIRNNLAHSALSLIRIDQRTWLDAVLDSYNQVLVAGDEPLSVAEIEAEATRLHRQLVSVKRLGRAQRFWTRRVRRKSYDLFITDSFTGAIL